MERLSYPFRVDVEAQWYIPAGYLWEEMEIGKMNKILIQLKLHWHWVQNSAHIKNAIYAHIEWFSHKK